MLLTWGLRKRYGVPCRGRNLRRSGGDDHIGKVADGQMSSTALDLQQMPVNLLFTNLEQYASTNLKVETAGQSSDSSELGTDADLCNQPKDCSQSLDVIF
ncbi:hypothetical protein MPTK1_4g11960 [Marchantia polymorpha subsp. ruderalis]|uniref:Uncharacterized protein n=2 Tax=Marchantia polymorpha TaxID=3197 RepID=A0AAF6B901_MARPO|nr:hypothetical protein MARPO_0011s0181 [Marchantia polymorpha]BBN08485.1 hypothetical protein Mp_4g11960 [Marchantia polymorpha subsp. ruderalis]|eukprot:PTQ46522.1 hypothetical protein MARPO_0011s0181 [Marchantia polymorpha]